MVRPNIARQGTFLPHEWYTLLPVVLIGVFLRFFRLGGHSIFLDESFSWYLSTHYSVPDIILFSLQDGHPPLYYILLRGALAVVPSTEAGMRALSAGCSSASLIIMVVFVARWWNVRAATCAGWLLAFSSFDIYYAQEARMYALFAFLWLLGAILLIAVMHGYLHLAIGWGIVSALLPWSHFYGVFAVGIQVSFLAGWWGWKWLHRDISLRSSGWLGAGMALAVIGSLPMFWAVITLRGHEHGGTWVPELADLLFLFNLWSVGISASRIRFPDRDHLVLPMLEHVSFATWTLIGVLTVGVFFIVGVWRGYRCGQSYRSAVLLSLLLVFVPVAVVYGYSTMFGLRMWAARGFLGTVPLFCLWSGIGISQVPLAALRRGIAAIIGIVALASLIPYHTTWEKHFAKRVFQVMAPLDQHVLLIAEPSYMARDAFYYLGTEQPVWKVTDQDGQLYLSVVPGTYPPGDDHLHPLCEHPALHEANQVWVYGWSGESLRERWPPCLTDKPLWVIKDKAWTSAP